MSTLATVVMILELPGEPRTRNGFPSRTTIVGVIEERGRLPGPIDRKSTRLNSSHSQISYAVFCLHKKNLSALEFFFFFFNDTATTEIYTLSLHDALPIFLNIHSIVNHAHEHVGHSRDDLGTAGRAENEKWFSVAHDNRRRHRRKRALARSNRSEEHTSELQSQSNLVCRLLLAQKKSVSSRVFFFFF